MNDKTNAEILAEMRAEISRTAEAIIRRYEAQYGITVERNFILDTLPWNHREYPEQHI